MDLASQPKSQLEEWRDLIRKQGNQDRARQKLRDGRLDKIIAELDSCNAVWYLSYTAGNEIANAFLTYQPDRDADHRRYVTERKRHIVETCIIPAMHACVRAGFLKPSDEK